jgi:hypothetical protein
MASSPACAVNDQASVPVPVALPADLPVYLTVALVADVAGGNAARTSSLVPALAARRSTDDADPGDGGSRAQKIIRRRRGRDGRWSVQTVYAPTSLDHRTADPALLATWARGHWSIESRLHWSATPPSPKTTARSAPPPAHTTSPACAPWRSTPYA